MFDFQKLDVYQKTRSQHSTVISLIDCKRFSKTINDQLSRASLSIVLNIAEGTSRVSNPSKRNFYVIARGSIFECVAIIEILFELKLISLNTYQSLFSNYEEISKMVFGLIKSCS